jgi:hypothetical protein
MNNLQGVPEQVRGSIFHLVSCKRHFRQKHGKEVVADATLHQKQCQPEYHKVLFSMASWMCPEKQATYASCVREGKENTVECATALENFTYCGYSAYQEFSTPSRDAKGNLKPDITLDDIAKKSPKIHSATKRVHHEITESHFVPEVADACQGQIDSRMQCIQKLGKGNDACALHMMSSIHCFTKVLCPDLTPAILRCRRESQGSSDQFKLCMQNTPGLRECMAKSTK